MMHDDTETRKEYKETQEENAKQFRGPTKNQLKDKLKAQRFVNMQYNKLQEFVMEHYLEELTKDGVEGAGDAAINIINEFEHFHGKEKFATQVLSKVHSMLNLGTVPGDKKRGLLPIPRERIDKFIDDSGVLKEE